MSQSSALSGKQFPMEDIGRMQSSDFPGMTMAQTYDNLSNNDRLIGRDYSVEARQNRPVYTPPITPGPSVLQKQRNLKADMDVNGQQTPARVDMHITGSPSKSTYGNGHHRYWAARDLSWTSMHIGP